MNKKSLFFLLLPFLGFSQVQIGQDITPVSANDAATSSVSISADGNVVAVGNQLRDGVRVFQNVSGNWIQIGQEIIGPPNSNSGWSVSLSSNGKTVVIGNPHHIVNGQPNDHTGSVQVYDYISGVWTLAVNSILGLSNLDIFGRSTAISSNGNIIAVGAPYADGKGGVESGRVRVYQRQDHWVQIGSDIDDGEIDGDHTGMGISLSSDGKVVAVGSGGSYITNGKVRVYGYTSGKWTKIGSDIVSENINEATYAVSLSGAGNIIAIGSPGNSVNGVASGHVRVYYNNSGNWTQLGQDIDGITTMDYKGYSVSLSKNGSILAVGSPGFTTFKSGHIQIYKYVSGNWIKLGNDIDGKVPIENFGNSVSISSNGDTVAVAATGSGKVRVYDISNLSSNEFVSQNFNIYPNPTSDVLNISLENNLVLQEATIYNNLGQVVKTATENVIDVSQLAKGLYFVEVTTDQGKATKKVVVK